MKRMLFALFFIATTLSALEKAPKEFFQKTKHTITLSNRQLADLEMILIEAFAPLDGFLNREDYDSVVKNMRLKDGTLWPIPITLDVDEALANQLKEGDLLGLKDSDDSFLAFLRVEDVWQPDKELEMQCVYNTLDEYHPAVGYLKNKTKSYYVGGKIFEAKIPAHYSFADLFYTPKTLKEYFKKNNIKNVVAFQTRNPMHRAHYELTRMAAEKTGAHLLLQPVIGPTKDGDIDPYIRVRCYREIIKRFPEGNATLCVLPLAMRMGGPREVLLHAIIRKNYGATHFIVGRDHAGPGSDKSGNLFYEPYEAQENALKYADEIGIEIVPFKAMGYLQNEDRYLPMDDKDAENCLSISGTQMRRMLAEGQTLPAWFTFPEISDILKSAYKPRYNQGLTIFITGLSAAGKSTLGKALEQRLMEIQDRTVSIFDGDKIRKLISWDLGFSKKDRSTNVRRVGVIASEVAKSGGIAICCMIAPYEEDRKWVKELVKENGNFIEIYVSTPIEVCEERDVKGLYSKARSGILKQFTGIDDPYESPQNPEVEINMGELTPYEACETVINYLKAKNYLK